MGFFGGLNGASADTRQGVSGRRKKNPARERVVYVPELSVVGAPTGEVNETPGDARNEELVGDLELGYRV